MSDVIHCFAFKNKKFPVLSIEFYKILRRKLKATNMVKKKKKSIVAECNLLLALSRRSLHGDNPFFAKWNFCQMLNKYH
jgi:hypothetical protein